MQLQPYFPILLSKFVLTLGLSTATTVILASAARAQVSSPSASATPTPSLDSDDPRQAVEETASMSAYSESAVPMLPTTTEEQFSTQADDLLPKYGDLAPESVPVPISQIRLAQETDITPESGSDDVNPDPRGDVPAAETDVDDGDLQFPVTGEGRRFSFGVGSFLGEPTALEGPTRELSVAAQSTILSLASFTGHLRQELTDNQSLLLEFIADPQVLGVDFSYTIAPEALPGAFSINVFNQRGLNPALDEGDIDVDLLGGDDPRVHRLGGGIEYTQSVTPGLDVAFGVNYQRVSVRDSLFSDDLDVVDELGNAVTVSDDGQDDLLTLNFAGLWDSVEGQDFALDGTRVRFGIDQAIPVGDADIFFNRIVANVTQFIPLRIFTGEPGTLVLNVQSGATFGDVPPYETLSLGGSSTVRGFEKGDVGSGSSFIQATAEYRFPLFSFSAFKAPIGIGGVLFVDYASDLGTADEVIGDPAEVRDKPGDGLGYGLGIHSTTPFGLLRFEFGFNDDGGNEFHFAIGDRF